jgi:hypothetical protein
MEERNTIVTEWQKTVAIVDVPTPSAPKT